RPQPRPAGRAGGRGGGLHPGHRRGDPHEQRPGARRARSASAVRPAGVRLFLEGTMTTEGGNGHRGGVAYSLGAPLRAPPPLPAAVPVPPASGPAPAMPASRPSLQAVSVAARPEGDGREALFRAMYE